MFGILSAEAGLSGDFESLLLPSLTAGLAWQWDVLGTTGVLEVVRSFTADFDHDGDVDGDDLLVWKTDYGTAGVDANSDGFTDGQDFLTWQLQFGSSIGAEARTAAVPEPTTLGLIMLCGLLILSHRNRNLLQAVRRNG